MKTKIILSFLSMSIALAAAGQSLENDDIYFSKKDRVKLEAARASESSSSYSASSRTSKKEQLEDELTGNPTDSYSSTNYSARQTNPEFAARQNAQTAANDNGDYFVNDYKYSTASNLNNFGSNYSNWYNNSWYTPAYYGSSINSWNTPYYGYNNPYYSPWYDPYWNYSGYSAAYSYYNGNPYGYGWGGSYNYWNRPYIGYSSGWGWNLGYGYGFSNYYYGYPSTVIVVNNGGESGGRRVVNGVRPTRGSVMYSGNTVTRTRGTSSGNGGIVTSHPIDGGRIGNTPSNGSGGNVSNNSRRSDEYYNRSWRYNTPANTNNSNNGRSNNSGWSNGNNSNTRSRYNDYNNGGWSTPSNQGRTSSPSFNNGGGGNFGGGGTRTHSAPSGGSGGRGRGH